MPPRNWPPRIHQHKSSGQDRVCYLGRHYYLGPTASEESRRRYAELIAEWARGSPPPRTARAADGLTVAELAALWEAEAERRYDPTGCEASQYRHALAPAVSLFGALPVARFGLAQLDQVREEMVLRGWNRKVVNHRISRVRTVWRWAERRGHAPPGSWSALRALEPLSQADRRVKPSPGREPCTWHDLARVCRRCSPAVRGVLLFLWYTGARPGEAREMRAGEIDRTTGAIWLFRPRSHKNAWRGQSRAIAIGPRCQALLSRYLVDKKPDDPVFDCAGKAMTRVAMSCLIHRAAKRAGVKLSAYSCRHAAKQRITRELGIDHARAQLGQATLSTTDRYAAGQDLHLAREVARRLG